MENEQIKQNTTFEDKGGNSSHEAETELDDDNSQHLLEKETHAPEIAYDLKTVPPDGGWGWFCVLGCAMGHFIQGGIQRNGGLIFVQLRNMFHGSAASTAWVLSTASVITFLLGPLASSLSNKFSARHVVIVGGLLSALGTGLSAFTTSLWQIFITLGVIRGLGSSLIYTPSLVLVNQYFNKRRGIAIGLSVAGTGVGTFALAPCIELLFENYGFRGAMVVLCGLYLNLCVCGALYRPLKLIRTTKTNGFNEKEVILESENGVTKEDGETSSEEDIRVEEDISAFAGENKIRESLLVVKEQLPEPEKKAPPLTIRWLKQVFSKTKPNKRKKNKILDLSLLKNVHFLVVSIINCLFTFTFSSYIIFTAELAISRGVSELEAAYLLSIQGVVDTLSRVGLSIVLDMKMVKYYRLLIYSITLLFISICYFMFPSMYGFYPFAVLCGSMGALAGIYLGQKSVVTVDVLGADKVSSSIGLMMFFQGFGSLIGPPFSGYLRDMSDTYDTTYHVLASMVLCSFVTLFTTNLVFVYCKDRCYNCRRR